MALRIAVLAALASAVPILPGRIMKYKKKEDLVGPRKKKYIAIIAEGAFLVTDIYLMLQENDLINFILLSLILMLSAVIIDVDTRCRIIPNMCLFPMLLIATGYLVRNMILGADWVSIPFSLISMFMMCFGLISLTSILHYKGYLGAGDIKYCAVAAFLFTFSPRIVGMLLGIILSMAVYLIPMFLTKKIGLKSLIAFGPFIGFGVMSGICWQYMPTMLFA